MGSSCYARGNRDNVSLIREYLEANNISGSVEFSGSLCENNCSRGPVVTINGKTFFDVDRPLLLQILDSEVMNEQS